MNEDNLNQIKVVDSHAHLDELKDLTDVLIKAKESGVIGIVAVGTGIESNKKMIQIAKENPKFVYPAIGYHPWEIKEEEIETNLSWIKENIHDAIALGEIGLDYKIKLKKEIQIYVFERLLEVACEFDKPVILHCRFSHQKVFEIVKMKGINRVLFHWYSGPLNLLDQIIEAGYFISATPALAYSLPHQEAIKRTPIEKILLETDSPVSYQGKEASPKDVLITLSYVSRLKGLDIFSVSKRTTANASQFFNINF
ncbi:MAG: TatD family hydrolase [Candidatus Omnitrophica bacterium]|nr:TatD family hydrolase [Candidatus Omnitrophota bacterium]